jgi:hypothetical protein
MQGAVPGLTVIVYYAEEEHLVGDSLHIHCQTGTSSIKHLTSQLFSGQPSEGAQTFVRGTHRQKASEQMFWQAHDLEKETPNLGNSSKLSVSVLKIAGAPDL